MDLHPDLRAALHAQLEHRRAALDAGARHVGWKIGGDIAEIDARAEAAVETDVAGTLARVSELLDALGLRLEPGDRVLAGSLTHEPVAPGQEVQAEIEGLGRVAVTIAP